MSAMPTSLKMTDHQEEEPLAKPQRAQRDKSRSAAGGGLAALPSSSLPSAPFAALREVLLLGQLVTWSPCPLVMSNRGLPNQGAVERLVLRRAAVPRPV